MSKLVVVVGVTGNQGGSVARRFLQDPTTYRVRGLTRNPSSAAAQSLQSQGVDIVAADLDDPDTLVPAFAGAALIFSVTNYWEPFFRPDCRARAAERGITCRRFAYEVEVGQGRNIADAAAATVDSLVDNGFIVSTLSHAARRSRGRFTEVYHFDAKAEVFPDYVREKHPALAAKMSCVQTGCFMTSFRLARRAYFDKQPDGTYLTRMPMSPDKPIQHLDVNADTGTFVHAVSRMPPGKSYMAAGTVCSWSEYAATWSKVTGIPCRFRQVSLEEMVDLHEDRDAGIEIGDMFAYSDDPGYDGGEELLGPRELREAGFECVMTTLEEFMRRQDWKQILNNNT